jgi:hypothetical protein
MATPEKKFSELDSILNLKKGEKIQRLPDPDYKKAYYELSLRVMSAIQLSEFLSEDRPIVINRLKELLESAGMIIQNISNQSNLILINVSDD